MKNVFFVSQRDVSTTNATITGKGPEEIRGDESVIAVNLLTKQSSASFAARCKSPSTIKPLNTQIHLMETGQEFLAMDDINAYQMEL